MSIIDILTKWGLEKVDEVYFRKQTDLEKIRELYELHLRLNKLITESLYWLESANNKVKNLSNDIDIVGQHDISLSIAMLRLDLDQLRIRIKQNDGNLKRLIARITTLTESITFIINKYFPDDKWFNNYDEVYNELGKKTVRYQNNLIKLRLIDGYLKKENANSSISNVFESLYEYVIDESDLEQWYNTLSSIITRLEWNSNNLLKLSEKT